MKSDFRASKIRQSRFLVPFNLLNKISEFILSLLYALIEREDQTAPTSDFGVGFEWPHVFKFLRDDLLQASNDNPNGANVQPDIGDFIMWQNAYCEIDNTNCKLDIKNIESELISRLSLVSRCGTNKLIQRKC